DGNAADGTGPVEESDRRCCPEGITGSRSDTLVPDRATPRRVLMSGTRARRAGASAAPVGLGGGAAQAVLPRGAVVERVSTVRAGSGVGRRAWSPRLRPSGPAASTGVCVSGTSGVPVV